MARTPKAKIPGQGSKRADGGKKLRRKAAMQGKRMKKTLMVLGGDDTREDFQDLLNQSDISIIGAKAVVHEPTKVTEVKVEKIEKAKKSIKKSLSMASIKTKAASKEMANGIATGISNGITKTKSLRNLRSGQLRLENQPDVLSPEPEKPKQLEEVEPQQPQQPQQPNLAAITLAKLPTLEGVKSLFVNSVWGVPYSKVLEQESGMDISVSEEVEQQTEQKTQPSKCRIS